MKKPRIIIIIVLIVLIIMVLGITAYPAFIERSIIEKEVVMPQELQDKLNINGGH